MHFSSIISVAGPLALAAVADAHRPHQRDWQNESRQDAPPVGELIDNCVTPGQVALTFDDGPGPFTAQLVTLLAELDVKATFFLSGNNTNEPMDEGEESPALVQEMFAAGHQLASHTWEHPDLMELDAEGRAFQMDRNDQAFQTILGVRPTYMRPPFLSCSGECLAEMAAAGYHVIDTNLDTKDFENNTPDTIAVSQDKFDEELGFEPAVDDFIVLAHDIHETTVTTLTRHMIETLQERGYQAVTVGECLGDAPENWYRQ